MSVCVCVFGVCVSSTHRCWLTVAHFIDFIDAVAFAANATAAADRNRMMVAAGCGRHQTHRRQGRRTLGRTVQLLMLEMMLLMMILAGDDSAAGWRWWNHSFHARPSLVLLLLVLVLVLVMAD